MIRFLGVVAALFVFAGGAGAQTRGAGILPLYLEVCRGTFEDIEARAASLGWLPYEQFALDEKMRLRMDIVGEGQRVWRLFAASQTSDFSAVYVTAQPIPMPEDGDGECVFRYTLNGDYCAMEIHGGANGADILAELEKRSFRIGPDESNGRWVPATGMVEGRKAFFAVQDFSTPAMSIATINNAHPAGFCVDIGSTHAYRPPPTTRPLHEEFGSPDP